MRWGGVGTTPTTPAATTAAAAPTTLSSHLLPLSLLFIFFLVHYYNYNNHPNYSIIPPSTSMPTAVPANFSSTLATAAAHSGFSSPPSVR